MFLRQTRRKKDGKTHTYWSVVENQRLQGGRVVQRHVAVSMNFGPLVLTNSGPPPVIKSAEPGRGQAQQVGVGSLSFP